eukprot:COSAG01_NODE_973_length_12368_cov_12.435732_7_plen_40_part_00
MRLNELYSSGNNYWGGLIALALKQGLKVQWVSTIGLKTT